MSHATYVFMRILTHATRAKQIHDCFRACRHTGGHRSYSINLISGVGSHIAPAERPKRGIQDLSLPIHRGRDVKQTLFIFEH